jgi:beta-ribofuranosylaminobenzene 5'-phosphate synthase
MPPSHSGLGSKTALLLAVVTGLHLINSRDTKREDLQRISGRGGTSGIGINTFFDGGFLADGGHANVNVAHEFLPSSASDGHVPPPVIARHPIPAEWQFTLLIPPGRYYAGSEEIQFFELNAPIAREDAFATIALLYHGVAAAVVTRDLSLLARSLADLHNVGFKRKEVEGQPSVVRNLLQALHAHSLAAGMSSMGPLVYVVTRTCAERDLTLSLAEEHDSPTLGTFSGRNAGFEVVDD